ncbi:aspartate aminotransferase family protein [Sinorhizobium meliloti]|uniref:aspartate aminotransferase family protein n=1 Tax=Rhizobium meliloti TaxID=382 RepID=UPI003D65750D
MAISNQPQASSHSETLYKRALKVMPGGNSRDSVYRSPFPFYAASAKGFVITDADGRERIDFLNNYTSLIHGHSHPKIVEAVTRQLPFGTAVAMPTEIEIELAELLTGRIPSMERIRFVNSGSEAVMMAIKAARGFTNRPKIAKMEGAYHGSYDFAEISQTSGPDGWGANQPRSLPVSQGTPQGVLDNVVVLPFNHIEASIQILDQHRDSIGAVLLDLMPHRVGFLPAAPAFVSALRKWATDNGALLIFDEVITVRLGYGGAQERYKDRPDLTAVAKIIGGGFPVGAVGGRADVMEVFNPSLAKIPVPHGGTFNANPITMVAGHAAMSLMTPDLFDHINGLGERARKGLAEAFSVAGVRGQVTGGGSLFFVHFNDHKLTDYRSGYRDAAERERVTKLVNKMLERGFILATTAMGCISTVMSEREVDALCEAFTGAVREMRDEGAFDAARRS